eukprot:gene10359-biopygen6503
MGPEASARCFKSAPRRALRGEAAARARRGWRGRGELETSLPSLRHHRRIAQARPVMPPNESQPISVTVKHGDHGEAR